VSYGVQDGAEPALGQRGAGALWAVDPLEVPPPGPPPEPPAGVTEAL